MDYVTNREAKQQYEILDTISAGISLLGAEVKSIRGGSASLTGARVLLRGNEAFLVQAHIAPFQKKNTPASYDPRRTRKLLLTKEELRSLASKTDKNRLTLLPLRIYNYGRHLKVAIGIAKKKLAHDKRGALLQKIARREARAVR